MKNYLITALLIFCFSITAIGQTSFGFRTGMNLNTLVGDLEEGETYENNTGFHIGIAFNRNFTDIWGVRAELLYSQKGTSNKYDGNSSIILRDRNQRAITHSGNTNVNLTITNSYIDFPITGFGRVAHWLEISAGIVPGILAASRGRGDLNFSTSTLREDVSLNLDYNYYGDNALEAANGAEVLTIKEENTAKDLTIPSAIGAYVFQEEKIGSLYNLFNLDAVVGLSFFLNKGLYVSGKVQYGLLDVTNNDADYSYQDITTTRSDKDVNLVLQGSVGFNF